MRHLPCLALVASSLALMAACSEANDDARADASTPALDAAVQTPDADVVPSADASAPTPPDDAGEVDATSPTEPDAGTEPEPWPPRFGYQQVLVDRHTAHYNPTKEFIFSSVIETTHIANPLGRYYLYYAPHDAPGGISLAYADHIEGPWTEYEHNPLITNEHQQRFSVTHVSSPHVVWMEDYESYFLYFHGENTTTRWSHSKDGLDWTLAEDNVSIRTSDFGTDYTECSYARVFEYAIPGIGDRFTMMMMLVQRGHGRRIGLATSNDGRVFTPRDSALITPRESDEGTDISGPFLVKRAGHAYVLYNTASGGIYYTDVGEAFDREEHLGAFYTATADYPEYGKASAPFLMETDGEQYLFYDVGIRLQQSVALAVRRRGPSVVVDQGDAGFTRSGSWNVSTSTEGFFGTDYLATADEAASANTWAAWQPELPQAGTYRVYVRFPAAANRPAHIKYKVYHRGSVDEVFVDQTARNGSWVSLGRYAFDAGSSMNNRVTLDAASGPGYAVADAAWFAYDE